ncbi:MAG: hypothetical protein WCD79_08045 [Chthoniobacteraceae bacterium]
MLNKGQYPEAFESASFAFQAQQSVPGFIATAKDLGLGDYPSRNWTEKSASEKEALLDGDFTSAAGEKLSLEVSLLKESGKWKIYTILTPAPNDPNHFVDRFNHIGRGQTFGDVFMRKVPSDDQVRALVDDTMQQFNTGLHKKNFGDFYLTTSALWRSETSKERVEGAFKSFVDAQISIDPYKDTKAVFSEPPRLNSEGMLIVKGYYPTKPNRIIFDLRYTFELPKWKLLAITISIKP